MFNLGIGEVMVIVLVIMVIFGPNKLPEMVRSFAKTLRTLQVEGRKAADTFRDAVEPVKELRRSIDPGVIAKPDAPASAPAPDPAAAPAEPAPPAETPPGPAPAPLDPAARRLEDT